MGDGAGDTGAGVAVAKVAEAAVVGVVDGVLIGGIVGVIDGSSADGTGVEFALLGPGAGVSGVVPAAGLPGFSAGG